MNENLFFGDAKLKKYYERDQAGDVAKFRARMHSTHSTKTFEKLVYVFVTDNIRDIILDTIGELTTDYQISHGFCRCGKFTNCV
jgi:hypothetical protein